MKYRVHSLCLLLASGTICAIDWKPASIAATISGLGYLAHQRDIKKLGTRIDTHEGRITQLEKSVLSQQSAARTSDNNNDQIAEELQAGKSIVDAVKDLETASDYLVKALALSDDRFSRLEKENNMLLQRVDALAASLQKALEIVDSYASRTNALVAPMEAALERIKRVLPVPFTGSESELYGTPRSNDVTPRLATSSDTSPRLYEGKENEVSSDSSISSSDE